MPLERELVGFAEAAVHPNGTDLAAARERLRAVGGTVVVNDAAAVIANFEMMTRIADLTGAAIHESRRDALMQIVDATGASVFATQRWG